MTTPSILTGLISPSSVSRFLSHHWPDQTFAEHGDPARLPDFLRAPELASVETLARHYRGGPLRFTQGRRYPKMVRLEQVDALALYRMGLTLQFEDIAPVVQGTAAALRQLECELGINPGAARISAFASPVDDGLGVHFDAQDIFSIQITGQKRFHIAPVEELRYPCGVQFVPGSEPFDDLYPQAGAGFPVADRACFTTVDMQPGSVLYLPRGTWHHTESTGDSLSVSIGLYVPAALDSVLAQLRLLLLQDPAWRRPLYGAWGDAAARTAAQTTADALLAELPQRAAQLRSQDIVAHMGCQSARLHAIQADDRFQKAPHSSLEIATAIGSNTGEQVLHLKLWDPDHGDRATVHIKQVRPEVAEVFGWCAAQTAPFRAGELTRLFPMFDFVEHGKILRAAVEGGLLRLLWYPSLEDAPPPSPVSETPP